MHHLDNVGCRILQDGLCNFRVGEVEAMVVLLTPNSVSSPYVRRDIEYALGAKNYNNRLIPVVVGDPDALPSSEIPWIVRHMHWLGLDDSETDPAEARSDDLPTESVHLS